MRTSSIHVLIALVILQFSTNVQGRAGGSPEIDDRIAESLNIVPRQLSPSNIEYRISGPNSLEMVPRRSSPAKIEDREPSVDHLAGYLPDSWRVIPRRLEPPRIEMQLLKGHVPEGGNLVASVEYRFSDNYEDAQPKPGDRDAVNETEDPKGSRDKPKKPTGFGLDSRTIFQVPFRPCAPGERRDPTGKCRKIY